MIDSSKFEHFIGWDVSKETLDYCIVDAHRQLITRGKIDNKRKVVRSFFKAHLKSHKLSASAVLNCLENTGHYSNLLLVAAEAEGVTTWMEDPFHLNASLGRRRDKTDALDAHQIALYACVHAYKSVPYELPNQSAEQIRYLVKQRLRLVSQRQALKQSFTEGKEFQIHARDRIGDRIINDAVRNFDKCIEELEKRIDQLIEADEELSRVAEIIESVPGFGPKNTPVVLALTRGGKKFKKGKACACFAGVSPHKRQSGTSIKHKDKVNKMSSRALKAAIHQGAKNLIRKQCEGSPFKALYDRLRAKGRTYRQAINAVRNKMITVLYACLEKDELYNKKLHQSLA